MRTGVPRNRSYENSNFIYFLEKKYYVALLSDLKTFILFSAQTAKKKNKNNHLTGLIVMQFNCFQLESLKVILAENIRGNK